MHDVEVIFTASEAATVERCHDLCQDHIISKPCTSQDLLRQISVLRGRQRRPAAPES